MYRLSDAESLSSENLRELLGDVLPSLSICVHGELDSTNTEAKRLAAAGAPDALIVAAHQTAGRGRLGRSFHSPADTGAYFSLLWTPRTPIDAAVTLTCAAAVAVRRAVYALTKREAGIKWVNDLYLDGKKICGILCESVCIDGCVRIVIGIGVNISTVFSGTELESIAGSLNARDLSPVRLIAEVVKYLSPLLDASGTDAWIKEYRAASTVLSRRISFTEAGQVREGMAVGIERDGALLVRTDDGNLHRLFSGEITVRTQ